MSLWEIVVSRQQGSLVNHFVFILFKYLILSVWPITYMLCVFLGSSGSLCEHFDVLNVKKYEHAVSSATLLQATYSITDKNRQG